MRKILCLFVILMHSFTYAGESARVGNGGGVLFCESRDPILLDIYESVFYEIHSFEKLSQTPIEQRSELLTQRIKTFSPSFARLFASLREYFYSKAHFIDNSSFKIPDDFNNLFYEGICDLKVVVVQRKPILPFDNIFFVNKRLWSQSGVMTQESLIDHELIYLLGIIREAQTSKKVREFLAYLLSDSFLNESAANTEEIFYSNVLKMRSDRLEETDKKRIYNNLCSDLKRDYYFDCPEY